MLYVSLVRYQPILPAFFGHQENMAFLCRNELVNSGIKAKVLYSDSCAGDCFSIYSLFQQFPHGWLASRNLEYQGDLLFSGITLYVRTLTGECHELVVDPCETIENVKSILMEVSGDPVDQQRLIFCGRQLEDGRTCSDYGKYNEPFLCWWSWEYLYVLSRRHTFLCTVY